VWLDVMEIDISLAVWSRGEEWSLRFCV